MNRLVVGLAILCSIGVCGSIAHGATYFDGRSKDCTSIVLGVRGSITTAPLPDLHGGTFSCVWVMAATDAAGSWAQAGYTFNSGRTGLEKLAQWKDNNGGTHELRNIYAPAAGDHDWEVYWTGSTDGWSFRYDGVQFAKCSDDPPVPTWTAGQAEFGGEVTATTVQMMGDATHKVTFRSFEVKVPSFCSASWTTIWPNVYRNDQPAQWAQEVSQANGYFRIYDTTP